MRKIIKFLRNSLIGKILKAILKVLWWAIEVLIIFIAIVIVTQRVTNSEKGFLGFRIFDVATGSMEPEYAVGDILISREKNPSQIKVGENIVYLGKEAGYAGKIITHQVIEIEQNEKGEYLFHTKGRANTVEDPIVHETQLYGVIVQNNRVLAFLCKILYNRYGLYFFVIVPLVLYAFVGFIRAQGEKIEQEREEERQRKRIQEERRAQRPRRRPKPVEEQEIEETQKPRRRSKQIEEQKIEETQGEEEIEEVIRTPKKTKPKTTTSKKKVAKPEEVVEEIEINEKAKPKPKKTTTRKKAKEE